VFDAEALNHVDATGVRMLTELIEALREESITLVIARLHSPSSERLRDAGVLDLVGEEHNYPTVHAAVGDAPVPSGGQDA
jgi:MFS superfamily sulfate permease-like transporter